jgi:hypothetical protein
MKRLIILKMILISFIWSPIVMANIYTWTDESNVRHFSNQSPPPGAEIFIKALEPGPKSTPETPAQNEKTDLIEENQSLEDRLNDTQEKLSETLEQVTLEEKIRNDNERDLRANEHGDNVDSESVDNSSYSEPENTPTRSTYYYPVRIIHNSHFAKKSHYRPRSSLHRPHKDSYYFRKHRKGENHNLKRDDKKRQSGKRHFRDPLYKKRQKGNQTHPNRYSGSTHNRNRRLGVHPNRHNLNLEFYTRGGLSSARN